jgi:hypothetical protein
MIVEDTPGCACTQDSATRATVLGWARAMPTSASTTTKVVSLTNESKKPRSRFTSPAFLRVCLPLSAPLLSGDHGVMPTQQANQSGLVPDMRLPILKLCICLANSLQAFLDLRPGTGPRCCLIES